MTILQTIIENQKLSIETLKKNPPSFTPINKERPSLYKTIREASHLQVIAEVKRASPSKGAINLTVDPPKQARSYEVAQAACISVLTEPNFFKGSYEDLNAVAKAVSIPVLCKDFIVDTVQIDYAKNAGASVILLIVAALSKVQLDSLFKYAIHNDLEVLVEVHTIEELQTALSIGATIIGVNNRNLNTFQVNLQTTQQIAAQLHSIEEIVFISESGIFTDNDAKEVASYGAHAILVGEALMKSTDVENHLRSLQVPLPIGESK